MELASKIRICNLVQLFSLSIILIFIFICWSRCRFGLYWMVTMKPSNRLSNIEKSCSNVATNATNFSQNKTVSYFNFTKVVEALNENQSPYDFNNLAEGLCCWESRSCNEVCTNNNSLFQGAIALTILWLDPKTWALVWLFF